LRTKPPLLAGALLGLLAVVLLLGSADTARAQTFNPTLAVSIENPEPNVGSNYTIDFNVPEGDVQFGGLVSFLPGDFGITPGEEIPIGALVGELTSQATLGLINGPCNNSLTVVFRFLNSSIDPYDTVPFLDTDDNDEEDFSEDKDNSGIPDAFEYYPDFITRVLDDIPGDEIGEPLQPIRRAAGISIVAGVDVLLQFLIFEPGTFIDEDIPYDEELGFPTVVLLQNAGDPTYDPEPSAITDFCTPLTSTNTTFHVSYDNPCTDDVDRDLLDPLCEATGYPLDMVLDGPETTPDERGIPLFVNPQDGTYTFTTVGVGQRDADGDGIENALDTCQFVPNDGDPRTREGDQDTDGLDSACDPDDTVTNSDEDLDGYPNRQDNCPLEPNGENETNQRDTDDDAIGDECDPNPDNEDTEGDQIIVQLEQDVVIGTGEGPGGPPEGVDGAADGDDDGGGAALIIIIVVVIAAVVVVGGGGFFFLRRRGTSGGGGAA
jgi:hypothetical protein